MGRRLIRNKKGAAMVELAIIFPALLIVLFGIIELSLILYNKAMITNASREGARAGIVFRSDPNTGNYSPLNEGDISTVVNSYLSNYLITANNATANTDVEPDQCLPFDPTITRQITVTVTYPYTFFILPNFVTSLVGLNPLNLRAVTVMRCE